MRIKGESWRKGVQNRGVRRREYRKMEQRAVFYQMHCVSLLHVGR